jgi:hypothetical protein
MKTVYLELTEQFNRGRLRAIICSGQAVVLHKLAIMSKDGDWIVLEDQLLYSRSARDLIRLAGAYPYLIEKLVRQRPLLSMTDRSADDLARALDDERRELIRKNENRLKQYLQASREWQAYWPELNAEIERMPLVEAHPVIVEHATMYLPYSVEFSDE